MEHIDEERFKPIEEVQKVQTENQALKEHNQRIESVLRKLQEDSKQQENSFGKEIGERESEVKQKDEEIWALKKQIQQMNAIKEKED